MSEVKLPSGSTLKIIPAPFEDAKELNQILLSELKNSKNGDVGNITKDFVKEVIFISMSSKKIEDAVNKCLVRCTVDDEKLTLKYFEDVEKRKDYVMAFQEIMMENVNPFQNGLFALFQVLVEKAPNDPA